VAEPPAAPSATEVVEHEIRVAASPETLFPYFTDPAQMVKWMGTEATLDPRPGGVCRVNPSGFAMASGHFVEVDPPRRVVFTWGWELGIFSTPPQSTLVEVSLVPDGEETVVRLVHSRLKPEAVGFHAFGWGHYLPRLATVASGGDPGPDPHRDPETVLRALSNLS
jgi:uncharacterized protein YndB with AHSA1/START domain